MPIPERWKGATAGEWRPSMWSDGRMDQSYPCVCAGGLTLAKIHRCPAVPQSEEKANASLLADAWRLPALVEALHEATLRLDVSSSPVDRAAATIFRKLLADIEANSAK